MILKRGMQHLGLKLFQVCINRLTLTYFAAKSKFGNLGFSMGKSENSGFFRKYCSLRPKSW